MSIGKHIPRCKERNSRDYSAYLDRNSKMPVSRRKQCHKCQHFFVSLDTHLRISTTCHDFDQPTRLKASTHRMSLVQPGQQLQTADRPLLSCLLTSPDPAQYVDISSSQSISLPAQSNSVHPMESHLVMATSNQQTSTTNTSQCLFCAEPFKALGIHLPKCKERTGRDYPPYLSKKTLDKKAW